MVCLDEDEKQIYKILIQSDRMNTEDLSLKSGLGINQILAKLLKMELKGLVFCHPGKIFEAMGKIN